MRDQKFWISTFGNVVRYIRERNRVSVTEISADDSVITFTVTDDLDNTVYNYPVTIRRELPEDWSSAKIHQNGKIINSQIEIKNDKNYIMFDVVPDSGNIQLIKMNFTGVLGNNDYLITSPLLTQNYPNPFNPVTTINYQLIKACEVELNVYNLLGHKVETLISERQEAGFHQSRFDATGLASGIYFYQIKAGDYMDMRRMLLIK
jgi:hypothetical protein